MSCTLIPFKVCQMRATDLRGKFKVLTVEHSKSFLNMIAFEILLSTTKDLFIYKIIEVYFGEVSIIFFNQNVFSFVECSNNIQVAWGVVACSINFMLHLIVFIAITLSIAGAFFPQNHLTNPIVISNDSMFCNMASKLRSRNIIKCVLP